MPRQKARVDKPHDQIKKALKQAGYNVIDSSKFGGGFPDLVVVLKTGRVALIFEVKNPPDHPTWRRPEFTEAELKFMMQLVEPVYRVIDDPQSAIDLLYQIELGGQI